MSIFQFFSSTAAQTWNSRVTRPLRSGLSGPLTFLGKLSRMKLSDNRHTTPVLASMLSAALVLFGFIGYTRLSVRELPDIDPPVISGHDRYSRRQRAGGGDGSPPTCWRKSSPRFRASARSAARRRSRRATSRSEFTLDRPVDVAAQDVRDKCRACAGGSRWTCSSR